MKLVIVVPTVPAGKQGGGATNRGFLGEKVSQGQDHKRLFVIDPC